MPIWPLTLAISPKAAGIVGGVVALTTISSFGLGYLKGANRAAANVGPVEIRTESTKDSDAFVRREEQSAANTDEDVMVVETKLPPTTLPDGAVEQRTRIRRQTVKQETLVASSAAQAHTTEKTVEKRVEIPCPSPADPWQSPAAVRPLPRWMAGPLVARDFSLSKTVFGGSIALRTGPVFWRLFADSHPQAGAAVEVFW